MLDRLEEVFCEVDNFCKKFEEQWKAYLIGRGENISALHAFEGRQHRNVG
jgi:hypothetical protein